MSFRNLQRRQSEISRFVGSYPFTAQQSQRILDLGRITESQAREQETQRFFEEVRGDFFSRGAEGEPQFTGVEEQPRFDEATINSLEAGLESLSQAESEVPPTIASQSTSVPSDLESQETFSAQQPAPRPRPRPRPRRQQQQQQEQESLPAVAEGTGTLRITRLGADTPSFDIPGGATEELAEALEGPGSDTSSDISSEKPPSIPGGDSGFNTGVFNADELGLQFLLESKQIAEGKKPQQKPKPPPQQPQITKQQPEPETEPAGEPSPILPGSTEDLKLSLLAGIRETPPPLAPVVERVAKRLETIKGRSDAILDFEIATKQGDLINTIEEGLEKSAELSGYGEGDKLFDKLIEDNTKQTLLAEKDTTQQYSAERLQFLKNELELIRREKADFQEKKTGFS